LLPRLSSLQHAAQCWEVWLLPQPLQMQLAGPPSRLQLAEATQKA